MNFSLIPNYQDIWNNTISYAVSQLLGAEPLTYISPLVVYNGDLYLANFNGGVNPPVGVTPDLSSLWTLFSAGGGGSGIQLLTSPHNTITITNPTGPTVGIDTIIYTVVHKTANYQFLASNIAVIMDSDTKTGTLPAANGPGVVPGFEYTLTLGIGANTGTLAVPVGESLNNVLNGTFIISGAENSASAYSDGISWFTK